jgi:aminoglycoside 6'-N-acetyltransferase
MFLAENPAKPIKNDTKNYKSDCREMIVFKPLRQDDLQLLYQWFQEPTINQQYAQSQTWSFKDIENKYLPRLTGHDNVPSFIIYSDNKPIGFIQYYCLSEHYPEGIQKESSLFKSYHPNQIAGIDLFIATHENRGQGFGVVIINQFINELLTHFRLLAVDPKHDNIQAIRCYEKSGFEHSNYSEDQTYRIMIKSIEKR